MEVKVIFFGVIKEKMGKDFSILKAVDTNTLLNELKTQYSFLNTLDFKLAVNQQLIFSNTILNEGDEVALLPPFSGG
jgi:molybdopterin converting factor small subunit